ncbi:MULTISPECIES: RNA polymerase sigma factor [unclassified Lentimicrobium]|uniref:RNA polymerase sigma factor n=1 Tax=unclassified Lentimicrobium TaxID=2677434 RepID=UPI0015539015|nr:MULTISPECIES: sigma-70 family RNA polymerase sigma factor [unclassified Lentimicrobium]NPD46478.1 sigma-70 family RNA polymerase sigma factor [Lentimicrobium sp. S6]NPD85984.1 sigma-70 family RNA polymerase sigma factor [Lentimicrobium sp. L6]
MKKEKYTTNEILDGIKSGNNIILQFIYQSYFDSIKTLVLSKRGNEDLAYDIFQDSLVVIYKKLKTEEFQILKSSFFTYFYSVCRITLFKYYSTGSKDALPLADNLKDLEFISSDFEEEERLAVEGIKEQLFQKYIDLIPDSCMKILKLVMAGFKAAEIANKLNLSSDAYIRKRKKICLETLIEMIKKDPKSRELL